MPLLNYSQRTSVLCHRPNPRPDGAAGCSLSPDTWIMMPNTPLLNQVSIWEVCDWGHGWKDPTSCSSQAQFCPRVKKRIPQKRNCASENHACQTHNEPSLFWKSCEHHSGREEGIPVPALPRTCSKVRPSPPNGDFSVWIVCLFYASSVLSEKNIFKVSSKGWLLCMKLKTPNVVRMATLEDSSSARTDG